MIQTLQTRRPPRLLAWALATLMAGPILMGLAGCGNNSSGGGTAGNAPTVSSNTPPAPSASGGDAPAPVAAPPAAKPGLSKAQKVGIVLVGAALLYYLYRKHQAAQQAQGGTASGQPQLYQSKNGGVYYRDPQNPQHVTWLTVPNQPVQVPADEVQRYAPDYQQYQGRPAPPAPAGYSQQPFSAFDGNTAGGG